MSKIDKNFQPQNNRTDKIIFAGMILSAVFIVAGLSYMEWRAFMFANSWVRSIGIAAACLYIGYTMVIAPKHNKPSLRRVSSHLRRVK